MRIHAKHYCFTGVDRVCSTVFTKPFSGSITKAAVQFTQWLYESLTLWRAEVKDRSGFKFLFSVVGDLKFGMDVCQVGTFGAIRDFQFIFFG